MIEVPYSVACERNKDPILEIIAPYLSRASKVLEIGTGTAQHAVYFAQQFENLVWQTSDVEQHHNGINAQIELANVSNVLRPLSLDVRQAIWDQSEGRYDLIFSANTLHIMGGEEVAHFFNKLPNVSAPEATLVIYGPFKYQGEFTSASNAQFDLSLRSNPHANSSIKDFEAIEQLANQSGYQLIADHAMPANNQCLVFQAQS